MMQLHDELIFEVSEDMVPAVTQIIKYKMQKVITLNVPLVVKVKTGLNWASVTDLEI